MTEYIDTITNTLADGYNRLEKGTFKEASEIHTFPLLLSDLFNKFDDLKNLRFYTANLPLFRMNDSDLEYGLGGKKTFEAIAGYHIKDFTAQILKHGVHKLDERQINQLEDLVADIVWAKAVDLKLNKLNSKWSNFSIDTSDFHAKKLNNVQRLFAVKVHGSLDSKYDSKQKSSDYIETMAMLHRNGIKETTVWFPTPTYLKKYINPKEVVALASSLNDFKEDSSFLAGVNFVDHPFSLCGILKIREEDKQKIGDVIELLKNPIAQKIAAKKLTPETAEGYLKVILNYLAKKQ